MVRTLSFLSDTRHPEGKGLKGTGLLEETFALDACLRYGYDNDPYVNEMDKYALVTLVGYEDLRPALQSSLKTETAKAAKERASVKRSRAAAQAKAERQAKSERAHARPKPGKRQLPKRR
jgi:hypothetical protein